MKEVHDTDIVKVDVEVLENGLVAPISRNFIVDIDVIDKLLSKQSPNTRRAYEKDLKDFFVTVTGKLPAPELVLEFLHLERKHAVGIVLTYQAKLKQKGLAEATINRRLAAIKSMVVMGREMGVCDYSLENIKGDKIITYRDTSGISIDEFKEVLAQVDRSTLKGQRDYAILRLLWGNALRRNEVSAANLADFDERTCTLEILGKGKGTQKQKIDLTSGTASAISEWTNASATMSNRSKALFVVMDHHHYGERIGNETIRRMVSSYCKKAGITKQMSPHRIRHSAITAALDLTQGNIREVQRLSRHAKVETVMLYDDNRQKVQKQVTEKLDALLF